MALRRRRHFFVPGQIIARLTFPGVIVQEMAHQIFCRLLRIPVFDVCYFSLDKHAGYVIHEKPKEFIASVSKKAEQMLKDKVKTLEIHKRTGSKIDMIEELNPILRGWMNYFGKINRSAMKRALDWVQRRLIKWAMCKYKNFRGHRRRADEWLSQVRKREPNMFAQWALYGKTV